MQQAISVLLFTCALLSIGNLWGAEDQTSSSNPASSVSADNNLPRRGMFGAALASVTTIEQKRQGLATTDGVMLEEVFPDTSAAAAEFKARDVIRRMNDIEVPDVATFMHELSLARAGDSFVFGMIRDGTNLEKHVTLKEVPRERDEHYETTYGHVVSRGARLRTIVTRPKAEGRRPAVLLLQGYGNFSIDQPVGPPTGFTQICRYLSRNGYATMRVDRRGCGDSEGGPCRDMDFETELDGYRQALQAIRELDFVDVNNIFIFGHSIGGFFGPILAAETPVRGIASYGTTTGSWLDGVLEQRSRLFSLEGTKPADVASRIQRELQFWRPLLEEKRTPAEIRKLHPEQNTMVARLAIDDRYIYDRHYSWLHQIADVDIEEVWDRVATTVLEDGDQGPIYPQVLSMWGTSDWVAERKPVARIDEIVNRVQPGNGTFIAIDASDHFFFHAASLSESFQYFRPPAGGPYGKFNPAILAELRNWLDETSGVLKPSD